MNKSRRLKLLILASNRGGSSTPVLAIPTNIQVVREAEPVVLLFKSGFETDVAVLAAGTGGWPSGYQGITGNDEGFDWGTTLIPSYGDGLGSAYSGIHVIGGAGDTITNELVTISGYDGTTTTVLRQFMDATTVFTPQTPYQINGITNIPNKTYIRFKIKFDGLNGLVDQSKWRMLLEYKGSNWNSGNNTDESTVRTQVLVRGNAAGDGFEWRMASDYSTGNIFLNVASPDGAGLNPTGWNLIEFLIDWSVTSGQLVFKLNGSEVFNEISQTLGSGDSSIGWLAFWQYYTNVTGSGEHWIDDAEIWSDDPLLPYVPPTGYGPNLVLDGTFDGDGSDWGSFSHANWTLDSVNNEADCNASSTGALSNSGSVENGKTYEYSFEIKNRTSGFVRIKCGAFSGFHSANQVHTGTIVSVASEAIAFNTDFTNGFVGSIDNVSVREVL